MRTTLTIADDVLASARAIASAEGMSLGEAISRLARRGLNPPDRSREDGPPMFIVPADAPPITPEMVRRALDEE